MGNIETREFGRVYLNIGDKRVYTIHRLADMISADLTPDPYEAFDYANLAYNRLMATEKLKHITPYLLREIISLGHAAVQETTLPDDIKAEWELRLRQNQESESPLLEDVQEAA